MWLIPSGEQYAVMHRCVVDVASQRAYGCRDVCCDFAFREGRSGHEMLMQMMVTGSLDNSLKTWLFRSKECVHSQHPDE